MACPVGTHRWRVEHDGRGHCVVFICSACGYDPYRYILALEHERDELLQAIEKLAPAKA